MTLVIFERQKSGNVKIVKLHLLSVHELVLIVTTQCFSVILASSAVIYYKKKFCVSLRIVFFFGLSKVEALLDFPVDQI